MKISGEQLATFAVIADTHVNHREDDSSSSYPCNALANARTRQVVAELNQIAPEFVMHLGDLVNPVPELPTFVEAAEHFKSLMADLQAPLHLVSGNHDVGDKQVSWMPAGMVNEENLALYEKHFGDHFYSFDTDLLHMVVINAQIINSGLAAEETQKHWLEKDLSENTHKRTFICTHYPPYVSNADENGNYDNIDEPGRTWLLDLIKEHSPEALFCGHVHNFWYDVYAETEMYLLPSTSFVRQDYSEMFRIEPGDQYGRNDEPKLGYFIVRVYEHGHVVENIRTYGRTLEPGIELPTPQSSVLVPQTKESTIVSVGLDMRHAWAEELLISPSGCIDEFERKLARNDYPVLALWEMGFRLMRVPIEDFIDVKTRRRMEVMIGAGHLFQVYSYGLPAPDVCQLLTAHAALIERLEIIINWEKAESVIGDIAALAQDSRLSVYLSRVNRKDTSKFTNRYYHMVSHGFVFEEASELAAFFEAHDAAKSIVGVMFNVGREQQPAQAALVAGQVSKRIERSACLYVKSTSHSSAEVFVDDADNANRFAETVVAGIGVEGVAVILDTFDDIDRGYFVRTGLVDRRFNRKLGSRIIGNLFGLMNRERWTLESDAEEQEAARILTLSSAAGESFLLVLSPPEGLPLATALAGRSCNRAVDLDTGIIHDRPAEVIAVPTVLYLE
jgi:predicted phosphodiesterase